MLVLTGARQDLSSWWVGGRGGRGSQVRGRRPMWRQGGGGGGAADYIPAPQLDTPNQYTPPLLPSKSLNAPNLPT